MLDLNQLKHDFFKRTERNLVSFDCEEFNLVKVVLDGLKVDYASKGDIRTPMFYSAPIYHLFQFIGRLKNKATLQLKQSWKTKKILVFGSGRVTKDESGNSQFTYWKNIIEHFKRENTLIIPDNPHDKNMDFELEASMIFNGFKFQKLTAQQNHTRKELIKSFHRIENSKIFNQHELKNIKIAIQLFFDQYKTMDDLFRNLNLEKCFFDQHYHREGFILALKRNEISCAELQHGLIARGDLFYVWPEQAKAIRQRALFPHKILMYGEYWKNQLLEGNEFSEDQIEILGDYLYYNYKIPEDQEKELNIFLEEEKRENIYLVATQTFMCDFFSEYIRFLSKELLKTGKGKILVKLHPHEKTESYQAILALENVTIVNIDINALFPLVGQHLTIYSTTVYDALKHDHVYNYSIYHESSKTYIDQMVENKVVESIKYDEIPQKTARSQVQKNYFYHEPNYNVLNG